MCRSSAILAMLRPAESRHHARRLFAALLILGLLQAAEPLRWQTNHVKEIMPGCGDPKNGCAHAEYTSVEVISGPPAVRTVIRKALRDIATLQSVRAFIAGYREEKKLDPGANHWYNITSEKVLLSTPAAFCVEFYTEDYSGGAHPNPVTAYHNFFPATGAELLYDDFLKDDDNAYLRLKEIAARHFEKEIADEGFYLTDNFGFTETGLRFTWNPYDLGPRVPNGTIEIPYSELRDLLKPQYLP